MDDRWRQRSQTQRRRRRQRRRGYGRRRQRNRRQNTTVRSGLRLEVLNFFETRRRRRSIHNFPTSQSFFPFTTQRQQEGKKTAQQTRTFSTTTTTTTNNEDTDHETKQLEVRAVCGERARCSARHEQTEHNKKPPRRYRERPKHMEQVEETRARSLRRPTDRSSFETKRSTTNIS